MAKKYSRIDVTEQEGVLIVKPKDKQLFDVSKVLEHELAEQTVHAANQPGAEKKPVVVDLSGIDLVSATFLSTMILLQRRMDSEKRPLVLANMEPMVQHIFRESRAEHLFHSAPDVKLAVEWFGSHAPTSTTTHADLTPSAQEPWRNTAV